MWLETQAICSEQKKKQKQKKTGYSKEQHNFDNKLTMYKAEIKRTILQLLLGSDEF